MKRRFMAAALGVGTLTASVGIALLGAGVANAAPASWEPDPNAVGTIAFFNASGQQVTSGSITSSPFADYVVGSGLPRTGDTQGLLYIAQPNPSANIGTWNKDNVSGPTTFPVSGSGVPSDISSLDQTHPVVAGASGDETLKQFLTGFPNTDPSGAGCAYSGSASGCTNTDYENVYQLRLETSDGSENTDTAYDTADVLVSGNTWTEIYGSPIGTSTALGSSENPSAQGDSVTYTATVTAADGSTVNSGTVDFTAGSTDLGSVPVSAGSASVSTSALTHAGSPYNVTAVYTPATGSGLGYGASTSSSVSQVVDAPATPTTTSLGITGNATTGTDAVMTATISPTAASGSVEFFDGSSLISCAEGANPQPVSGGSATCTLSGGFSAGPHSVVAKFTSDSPSTYGSSQSAPNGFTTTNAGGVCSNSGSQCTDTQYITAAVPTGTLIISTPYDSANPLDLGTLALNTNGTAWTGSQPFQCITVTDTDGVNTGFMADALASNLSLQPGGPTPPTGASTSISGEDVGLTGLAPSTGNCGGQPAVNSYSGAPGSITHPDNAAANPPVSDTDAGTEGLGNAPHLVLEGSPNGVGTATYDGTLTINAPTSTAPGQYNGTITFTVSDGE